jgi:hypothetical protein
MAGAEEEDISQEIMMRGILLLGQDDVIESRAKRNKIVLQRGDAPGIIFDKTLITTPGTRVPWDLLPAAWRLLDKWDALIPLWRYDATAESAGTVGEREETRLIVRDIRVLLHATELLFVRRNEAGEALVESWVRECAPPDLPEGGVDKRLAFLRALYRVKPRLCVLPTSWLVGEQGRGRPAPIIPSRQFVQVVQPAKDSPRAGRALVMVELEPGRSVKCYAGDEEKVKEQFRKQKEGRHGG